MFGKKLKHIFTLNNLTGIIKYGELRSCKVKVLTFLSKTIYRYMNASFEFDVSINNNIVPTSYDVDFLLCT